MLFEIPNVEDLEFITQQAEKMLDTKNDDFQPDSSVETCKRMMHKESLSWLICKKNKNIIAWSGILPTSRYLEINFLDGKITEDQLLKKSLHNNKIESLYIMMVFVMSKYRGQNLGVQILQKHIQMMQEKYPEVQNFFAWAWSEEGRKTLIKFEKILHRKIKLL